MEYPTLVDLSALPEHVRLPFDRIATRLGCFMHERAGCLHKAFRSLRVLHIASAEPGLLGGLCDGSVEGNVMLLVEGAAAVDALCKRQLSKNVALLSWPASDAEVLMHLSHLLSRLPTPASGSPAVVTTDFHGEHAESLWFELDLAGDLALSESPLAEALNRLHPDDATQFRELLARCGKSGVGLSTEVRCADSAGDFNWVRFEAKVVDRSNKSPGRLVGFRREIEDEIDARRSLWSLGRQLEEVLAGAGMATWEWSRGNQARQVVADGLGWWNDSRTTELEALFSPAVSESDRASFKAALENSTRYESEAEIYLPVVGSRRVRITGTPLSCDVLGVSRMSGVIQDITDRCTRETELRQAQKMLLTSLDAGNMYCWDWDLITGQRRTLGASERILGAQYDTFEDVLGVIHPEDRESDWVLVQQAIANGGSYHNDFRIVRLDGEIRWLQSLAAATRDESGRVSKLTGVVIDVTERREAERSLEDADRRAKLAMSAAQLNPWSVDLLTERHFPGPLDEHFFGQRLESQESFYRHVHPDDLAVVARMRDPAFLRSGEAAEFMFRVTHADQKIRWIRCQAQGVCDSNGDPVQLVGVSQDVTQLHLSTQQLLRTQSQIDDAQRATGLALWEWSPAEGLRYYRSGGRFYERDEVPEIAPEDRTRVLRALVQSHRRRTSFGLRFRIRHSDGRPGWASIQGGATQSTGDGSVVVSGVLLEISELHEAFEQAGAMQSRLEKALEAGGMSWWTWRAPMTPDGKPGIRELMMQTGFGKVHEDDAKTHLEALHDAFVTADGRYDAELRISVDGGPYEWHLVRGQRDLPNQENFVDLSGVTINIAQRKSAEESLLESREWQQVAVGAAELNLWRINLDSGTRVGGHFDLLLYGDRPASLDDMLSRIEPEDRGVVEDALASASATGAPFEVEYRLATAHRGVRWIRDKAEVVHDDASGEKKLLGVSIDVSSEYQATEELHRALRLANEASEAKSGFLAAMSHELRTPLNAVIGFANLLQDNLEPSVRESHLHGLQVAAHQLMSVIDDVLDFSRVEARALKLEEISFSLIDCVASTLQMVAGSAESKGLCLTMVEHGAAGMRFVGDPARVRQIALNLLSNAVKFTHDGAVSLSLGIFRDGACADVVIAVADSGIGMSQETLEKLFTPFRQGDTSTVRQYGGSGLGLSICRSLVELMGGRIDVDSALGQGSRFLVRLRLPVAAGPDLPSGRLLAGHRIGFTVRSPHLESTLRNQLREYGATPVFVPPTQFTEETLKEAGSFSALVVGHAMLQRAADFESWPLASEGTSPLPVIPLVGMDASQAERLGPHGERIIPVSRALTPSQLLGAIQSCISGSSVARYARNEDFDQLMFEGLQVLVVEDNEINQTILSMQLESLGIVPVLASGGQEAIELLVQHRCDIILMDVEMPGMDGLQATTSILDSVADDQLAPYVIAVTAHVFGDTRERMRSAGMVDFVAKPVVMDDLRAALARGKAAVTRGVQQPGRQAESQPRIPMQS